MMRSAWFLLSLILLNLLVACQGDVPVATEANPTAVRVAPAVVDATLPAADAPATLTPTPPTTAGSPTTAPAVMTPTALPTSATDELSVTWAGTLAISAQASISFPGARSISATVADDGTIYVVLGQDKYIFVARSADGGQSFSEPVQVSPDRPAFVLPFERPAIAASGAGQVSVAWSSPEFEGRIWGALSQDGGQTFSPAQAISEKASVETVLPRLTLDAEQNPLVVWLANSTLQLARSADSGASFGANQLLDEQTCECCHPQPLVIGEQIYVAYRNLELAANGDNIRDIFFIRSLDGGQSFSPEVRVSDANWLVNACPVSGPSLATDGQRLFVSWMDGRNDAGRNFSHTDIWLAVSEDGGASFSANRRINHLSGIYHNLPSLVVSETGLIHLVWEAWESEREALYYAQSADGGVTFTQPTAIVASDEGSGRRPGNTSLLLGQDGTLYMSWVDGVGAHFMSWRAAE